MYNDACNYIAVDYQRIVYGNIANQIHGYTIDYGKYMLIRSWFLIDLTIKLMMIIKLLLDVSTLSIIIFKSYKVTVTWQFE